MAKKLGIILGSGGTRGFTHIGFLQAMAERGIKPDVMTGCSIGAVLGAAYLSGKTPAELKKIAFSLKQNDIVDFNFGLYKGLSLLRSVKMDKLLRKNIAAKTFEDLPIPFATVATDLVSGKLVTFTEGDLIEALKATAGMPTIFSPVKKDGMILIDGGVLNRTPVAQAKDLGAEVTVAVDILGKLPDYVEIDNIIQLATRTIDVADQRPTLVSERDKPDLMLIADLKSVNQYVISDQQFCYDVGYELGISNADKILELVG